VLSDSSRTIQLRAPAEVGWHIGYHHDNDVLDLDGVQFRLHRLDRLGVTSRESTAAPAVAAFRLLRRALGPERLFAHSGCGTARYQACHVRLRMDEHRRS
jgi:hypothetical protein